MHLPIQNATTKRPDQNEARASELTVPIPIRTRAGTPKRDADQEQRDPTAHAARQHEGIRSKRSTSIRINRPQSSQKSGGEHTKARRGSRIQDQREGKAGRMGLLLTQAIRKEPKEQRRIQWWGGGLEPPLPITEPWSLHEFLGKVLSCRWG